MIRGICLAPRYIAEDLLRAEGFTDIRYVTSRGRALARARSHAARSISTSTSRHRLVSHLDAGVPITVLAGVHAGLLRAVRARADPNHQRPEGQEGRHPRVSARARHLLRRDHGGACRARSRQGHRLGHADPTGNPMELFAERKSRCVSRLSARAAGAARPQDRSRDHQHGHGPAMVAVFLLHAGRQQGLRPQLIRSRPSAVLRAILKAADICAAEPERAAQRLVDGGFTRALRLRAPDAERAPVRQYGASSTPRTRCGSTRCGCTRSA